MIISSFDVKNDICCCFYVGNPCVDVKLESFQQGESYIDLRASLFQQEEFDTDVCPIEEIGTWESMVGFN